MASRDRHRGMENTGNFDNFDPNLDQSSSFSGHFETKSGSKYDKITDVNNVIRDSAAYSVHIPLQHCGDKVLRVLRFVEGECEVLPSKERCPYLLLAEVVEQDFQCKSHELYVKVA